MFAREAPRSKYTPQIFRPSVIALILSGWTKYGATFSGSDWHYHERLSKCMHIRADLPSCPGILFGQDLRLKASELMLNAI